MVSAESPHQSSLHNSIGDGPLVNDATTKALVLCLQLDDVTLLLFNSFVVVLTTAESSRRLWAGHPAVSHLTLLVTLLRGGDTGGV